MTTGKAYGFFNCNQPKDAINAEVPSLRRAVGTPNALELTLIEGVENLSAPRGLKPLVEEARQAGVQYVFEARYEGATHRQTADELAAVLNQMYNSGLYQEDEDLFMNIVYQAGNHYVFRE